jgi:cytochrome b
MHTTTPSAAPTRSSPVATRRVTDAPTRMFHWLFALCFVGAYATADGERWRLLHVTLGYTLAGLLGFRVLYGLVGPQHSRLSLLWRKVNGLPKWLRSFKPAAGQTLLADVNWRQGQNLAMAGAVVLLMALVLPLTLSGYATYNEWGGEWLEEVHEFVGEFFLWTVLTHLGLLLGLSLLRRKNQALPMLTGRIEGNGPDFAKRNHVWLAGLLLAAVLGYWAWEWQQAPTTTGTASSSWTARQHSDD